MSDDTVKVKCSNKRFMGVDQYGTTYHGLKHPRKDLLKRLGARSAKIMYVGDGKPVGYVIPIPGERGPGLWISVYEVCNWKPDM